MQYSADYSLSSLTYRKTTSGQPRWSTNLGHSQEARCSPHTQLHNSTISAERVSNIINTQTRGPPALQSTCVPCHWPRMALASTSYRPAAARCVNTRRGSVVVRAQQRITAAPLRDAGLAFLASAALLACPPALADLNVYEAAAGGEFGIGSALQYGEADVSGRDFSNQDLRRSNFTSADCRKANFKGSNLQGAYFMKAVTYKTNFEGANLSDVLMDRAVMNEANLKDAILERAVFTRSDLTGAIVDGADFTNALVDKTQQMALCKYADGVNPVTGVSTRKSLGCGSMRRFKAASPSNPDGPQVAETDKEAFRATMPVYRQ